MAPYAEGLVADVDELAGRVKEVKLQAVQIDFKANVEGSEVAFEDVKPLMQGADAKLAEEIEEGFAAVFSSLEPYERGDGFVLYTTLTKADTRKLAQGIDALAENISHVPSVIVRVENGA